MADKVGVVAVQESPDSRSLHARGNGGRRNPRVYLLPANHRLCNLLTSLLL